MVSCLDHGSDLLGTLDQARRPPSAWCARAGGSRGSRPGPTCGTRSSRRARGSACGASRTCRRPDRGSGTTSTTTVFLHAAGLGRVVDDAARRRRLNARALRLFAGLRVMTARSLPLGRAFGALLGQDGGDARDVAAQLAQLGRGVELVGVVLDARLEQLARSSLLAAPVSSSSLRSRGSRRPSQLLLPLHEARGQRQLDAGQLERLARDAPRARPRARRACGPASPPPPTPPRRPCRYPCGSRAASW